MLFIQFLKKLLSNSNDIKVEKDIQLICTTVYGRNILSKFLYFYPEDFSIYQDYENVKRLSSNIHSSTNTITTKTVYLKEKNFIILSILISSALLSIFQNAEKINFENTKLLTFCLFKYYT